MTQYVTAIVKFQPSYGDPNRIHRHVYEISTPTQLKNVLANCHATSRLKNVRVVQIPPHTTDKDVVLDHIIETAKLMYRKVRS